jgi:hypothetical protein
LDLLPLLYIHEFKGSYIVLYKNQSKTTSELSGIVNKIISEHPEDVKVPIMYRALDNNGFNLRTEDTSVVEEIKADPEVLAVYPDTMEFLQSHNGQQVLYFPHAQEKGDHAIDRIRLQIKFSGYVQWRLVL